MLTCMFYETISGFNFISFLEYFEKNINKHLIGTTWTVIAQ